ncbi:Gfo/Idh/MocA family protein [Bacilliculturomica massiliensis]|uniref:Gfo/Idh/MocA family protein n=1 Tax=Bacilliculturomica massiliensis TaxID=1917867 RepID=UPI00102F5B81|nr:Gfo/Idh/MocA family oxidoreductase [Bacilliculturomica massiliensis]
MYKMELIGCGRISYKHVQAAIENKDKIELVAFCDPIKERAAERCRQYTDALEVDQNPLIYTNHLKMLDEIDCDIVAIATESGFHAEIAIECMKRGKHVIVEKPMALSTEDAERMIQTADENHVKLCVCHQNRFNPPIQKLRQALDAGRFGRIIAGNARILWNRDINYYKQAPWRGTYEQDGGCLMNQCIHGIDLLQWMLGGEMDWLNGTVGNYMHPYIEAEDYGSIQIRFKNGAIGNVEGTVCVYPKNLEETLTIIGENGTVAIGGLAVNKIETWDFADGKDTLEQVIAECNGDVENVYGSGHTPLYADMIEAIEQDRVPYIDGREGKKGMEIILATYRSSQEERRIRFPVDHIRSLDFI